jgi:hypothetical protein
MHFSSGSPLLLRLLVDTAHAAVIEFLAGTPHARCKAGAAFPFGFVVCPAIHRATEGVRDYLSRIDDRPQRPKRRRLDNYPPFLHLVQWRLGATNPLEAH